MSRHKEWVFIGAAIMLAAGGWLIYRPGRSCPADPVLAARCARLDRGNRRIWWSAIVILGTGFFITYLLRAFLH